ncbi:nuclear pore complex protein NUP1-like isoform X3 [Panicum virgatum]|uniref:nuclear pore complex protein NUP1-like isoform X3 n=1 Tax=Panicum virgatum TaxID=38727 RepID=UPI0019D56626|nr:nuclear pore complex protein NUP1-like isoform X3 [Panicum virgatum]
MEPRGYDYGGSSGAGGKIRRRPPSRTAATSPYARPAPAPSPVAAAASPGSGWLSRIIAAGTSRLLPSLFRKPPPQLTAPAPPPPPQLTAPAPSPPPELVGESPSRVWLPETRREALDALPSSLPPPLEVSPLQCTEDDLPEGEENIEAIANDNLCTQGPQNPAKEKEDMLRNSENHRGMDLEELLKQKTFTRSEFEHLSKLLWSRTVGSSSLKPEDGSIRKMPISEQENGSRRPSLPVDFSIRTYSVSDQVASPAEIAKAYMGSKSSKGSPLRLRLHDPSMTITSIEGSMIQKVKPPTIPLLQRSRLQTSKISDRLESNNTTPNRSAIYKMSSSPYFKVLKRKSAIQNEMVSAGPVCRVHQRFNRTSPLLETRPGYRRYHGGHGSQLDEGSKQLARTQKRRCLDKVGDATLGSLDDKAHANSFGQAPVQSAEMAANILKQLDTLVPAQKENMSELKQKHGNAVDFGNLISPEKEASEQNIQLGPPSVKDTPAVVTEKTVDATNKCDSEKAPTCSLRSHPPNLVLPSENNRNKMSIPSNGFTFPIQAGLGTHSVAPPTPTLASPPILPVEKQQSSAVLVATTSMESHIRISQSLKEEGSMLHKVDDKLNADNKPVPSKNSGQGASFTSNPVFNVVNSKPTSLSNVPRRMSNSNVSAIQPSNGSTNSASFQFAGSTISTTASKSTQSSSTGGSFTFSNTGVGSSAASNVFVSISQSVVSPSLASSGTGNSSAPFGFSPPFGIASSSAAMDKSKAVSSSTPFNFSQKFETATQDKSKTVSSSNPFSSSQQFGIASSAALDKSKAVGSSTPFGFSQQYGMASSSTAQDISKSVSAEPTVHFGNQNGHSANSSSLFTQSSVNNLSFKSSQMSNNGSSQSSADSQVGSAPLCSSNASSLFPQATGSGSTSVAATALPSSATSSGFGSSSASSTSPMFGSQLTTSVPSSFGMPNTGPATSLFSPTPSAVFSFTSSTPSIPNPSPTTPFGGPTFPATSPFGLPSSSPSTPTFSTPATQLASNTSFGLPSSLPSTPTFNTPATQFASNTSSSPGVFGFGQQSQASTGGFSMGTGGGGNDKSGRRIIRAKRRK